MISIKSFQILRPDLMIFQNVIFENKYFSLIQRFTDSNIPLLTKEYSLVSSKWVQDLLLDPIRQNKLKTLIHTQELSVVNNYLKELSTPISQCIEIESITYNTYSDDLTVGLLWFCSILVRV